MILFYLIWNCIEYAAAIKLEMWNVYFAVYRRVHFRKSCPLVLALDVQIDICISTISISFGWRSHDVYFAGAINKETWLIYYDVIAYW